MFYAKQVIPYVIRDSDMHLHIVKWGRGYRWRPRQDYSEGVAVGLTRPGGSTVSSSRTASLICS